MAEASDRDALTDSVVAHARALFQAARRGPPHWVQYDLNFGQLRLLFFLAQNGPVSVGQLAETLGVSNATASEIVDRLERRGLATRSHRSDDRRVVECRLSDDGARLLSEIAGARREALRRALALLTLDELAVLDHLLATIAQRSPAATAPPTQAQGDAMTANSERDTTPGESA
jgi:DNA-binding MarR family transcriptional regulator